jgi:hypothetical protein
MNPSDFLQWPLAVKIGFLVMLWPVIWGGTLMTVALAGDIVRLRETRRSPLRRDAA